MNINNPNNEPHALILTSKYTGNTSQEIEIDISLNSLQGDMNQDGAVNVQDIILTINIVLINGYDYIADINLDNEVNIQDIILLVNSILSS